MPGATMTIVLSGKTVNYFAECKFLVDTPHIIKLRGAVLCLRAVPNVCRKTNPKQLLRPITTDTENPINQSELKANTCRRRQARENACDQVTIGFGLTSDWLRRWHESFLPIAKSSNAKLKQWRNYFRFLTENRSNIVIL